MKVQRTFEQLKEEEKVAQMLVVAVGKYGKKKDEVARIIKKHKVGGILLLNGTKNEFINYVKYFNQIVTDSSAVPLLYSADAEPSLIHYKIKGVPTFKATSLIEDETECEKIALDICKELSEIGIQHNYAPVCDLTTSNAAIKNRSFGSDEERVIKMSTAFMNASQGQNIITTAKHFPGHGYVKGDTHKSLVYIDGELKELDIYKKLIENNTVASIMIGHIAVKNNEKYDTDGMPASCSRVIVTDLLKNEMGFNGLIVTDAMNMGAVSSIPDSPFLAAKAGCDMILMIEDEDAFIEKVLAEMENDEAFKEQIYESVKKIIRYKVALGLI